VAGLVFNPKDTEGSAAILRLLGIFSSARTPQLQSTLAIANLDPTPILGCSRPIQYGGGLARETASRLFPHQHSDSNTSVTRLSSS
jgi:hypothetical protein